VAVLYHYAPSRKREGKEGRDRNHFNSYSSTRKKGGNKGGTSRRLSCALLSSEGERRRRAAHLFHRLNEGRGEETGRISRLYRRGRAYVFLAAGRGKGKKRPGRSTIRISEREGKKPLSPKSEGSFPRRPQPRPVKKEERDLNTTNLCLFPSLYRK